MRSQIISGVCISIILLGLYQYKNDDAVTLNDLVSIKIEAEKDADVEKLKIVDPEIENIEEEEENNDSDENDIEEDDINGSLKEIEEIKNSSNKVTITNEISKKEKDAMEKADLSIKEAEKKYANILWEDDNTKRNKVTENILSYKKDREFTEVYLTTFINEKENENLVFNTTYEIIINGKNHKFKLIERIKMNFGNNNTRKVVFQLMVKNNLFNAEFIEILSQLEIVKKIKIH